MRYFTVVNAKQLESIWDAPGLVTGIRINTPETEFFVNCKKDGTPTKNCSAYRPSEMLSLGYKYGLVKPNLEV